MKLENVIKKFGASAIKEALKKQEQEARALTLRRGDVLRITRRLAEHGRACIVTDKSKRGYHFISPDKFKITARYYFNDPENVKRALKIKNGKDEVKE